MDARLGPDDLRFDPPRLDRSRLADLLDEHWGLHGTMTPLDGERDQNTHVVSPDGSAYVLKIASPSEDPAVVDLQCAALAHVAEHDPSIDLPRVVPTRDGRTIAPCTVDGDTMCARVLTFVDGVTFEDAGTIPLPALEEIGAFQGRLASALRDFQHPAADGFVAWALDSGMASADQLWDDLSEDGRAVIGPLRERVDAAVAVLPALPRQVLHNDGHRGNLLRRDAGALAVSGVIDFGDVVETAVVADLAVMAASFAEDRADVADALEVIAAGYHRACPLGADEIASLLELVVARRVLGTLLVEQQARHAAPDLVVGLTAEVRTMHASARAWGALDRAATTERLLARLDATTRTDTTNGGHR